VVSLSSGGVAKEEAPPRQGFLRALLSDYRAFAGLVGVLIYGVVRVAYDSYYTRLGVFPEAVGLSETTILGRAALYLALTVSVTAIFGGLWLLAVSMSLERSRAPRRRLRVTTAPRLFVGSAALAVLVAALVPLGGTLRSLLGSYNLVYFCVLRCKFAVLTPTSYQQVSDVVHGGKDEHPGYRFVDSGPAWLISMPLILILLGAALGLVFTRTGRWSGSRVRPAIVFAIFAAASFTAGLVAPHLIAVARNAADSGNGLVDSHPLLVKWGVFVLALGAVAAGLLAALGLLAGPVPRRSPWLIASFVAVLPLLLGFFEPTVPLFIEDEGGAALAAAVVLWIGLMAVGFWLWPHLRDRTVRTTAGLGVVVAVIVTLTLFLAWERGLNLAQQAAMGDQIFAKRFGMLSVRSSVVCLDPTEAGTRLAVDRHPYVYLGETGGTLVLYDYVADRAHDTPTAFPLRMPASGITVRLARFNPTGPNALRWVNWDCGANV
jgi:hypothetical protein